jgi:ABC-type antimicrobial peptide transport system permease subunit
VETALAEYGCDVQRTDVRLQAFMAVQNTYLSTFQTLGGLGLLLGAGGLAVVQMRNVLERRGELALLRAIGFRPGRLATMVWLENAWLLFGGLAAGAIAAGAAVWPHVAGGRAALPWGELALTLGGVAAAGSLAGLAALRAALGTPLLTALREE